MPARSALYLAGMFDQLKGMKQLAGMLGNLGDMKEKMEALQAELAAQRVEGQAGGGAVRVTANGNFEVLSLEIDDAAIGALGAGGTDGDMARALIVGATNDAIGKVRELAKDSMMGAM